MFLLEVKPQQLLCGHMSRFKKSAVLFFTQSFAAAFVRSELVALNAPALEPPLCIGTALAAVAFFSTLIHIWKGRQEGRDTRMLVLNSRRVLQLIQEGSVTRGLQGEQLMHSFGTHHTFFPHLMYSQLLSCYCKNTFRIWE